ncbi:MAG TPA: hypothetical protein DCS07_01975 [Bdellovibrionales bacterium]|nr:MAG: hypothetical protein A2Z97_04775 [Bdellovibrionales bacterium GWB1_52_6]OFZ05566.1 MAG: hypothetical protein A2X97_11910 [Bdellovibrionales bacterium GWA1_52_35]OFZ41467.1 MAG: hypothetical protein A2070_06525 [Bdellovibrionales bacterium GWC1_52_8]HAR41392.1 hypothetical protein [Bdellovibrionales bacterium]HCM39062.1 hypothetical protein [Bdellovibrionales bacterium]
MPNFISNDHPSPSRSGRRKTLLIFPRFQLSIIGVNVGIILTMALLLWVAVENAFRDLQPAAGLSVNEATFFRNYVAYQATQVRIGLLVAGLCGIAISVIATLIMSHKFAGPLVRLRNYFTKACDGTSPISELNFRDGDFLSEFPPLVNKAMAVAQERGARNHKGE